MIGLIRQMCSQAVACRVWGMFRRDMSETVRAEVFEKLVLRCVVSSNN